MKYCELLEIQKKKQDKVEEDSNLIEEVFSEELAVRYSGRNYGTVFPQPKDLRIEVFQCSRYARKIANLEGLFLNTGNAWDLPNKNKSEDYNYSNLKKDVLVLFYNPGSIFNKKGRIGTHVAYCLGKDSKGEFYFLQQLKINAKILSETQMKKRGFIGKKIIFPKKF